MSLPTYDQFIEPVLRALTRHPKGARARDATSTFKPTAVQFAQSVERVVLVDGRRLVDLMIEHGVGVSHRVVKVAKLDSDYLGGVGAAGRAGLSLRRRLRA